MSSKSTEKHNNNRAASASFRAWSLSRRLTLLYTASTAAIIILCALILYFVLITNLEREDHESLLAKIHVLSTLLKEHPENRALLQEEIKLENAFSQSSKYYARILDESGHPIMETPGMVTIIPVSAFPFPARIAQTPGEIKKWESKDGGSFILLAAEAELGGSGGSKRTLQAALDVSHEYSLIVNYRRNLTLVFFAAILISVVFSLSIARKGMRPLKDITKAVHRISAIQLHERISPGRWPIELTALASAFDDMLNRLEDSFIRLSQFSADLAHELRTPITNLVGEAEVALSRTRTPEEYRQVLESSLEEYAKLSRMIENLLFLARAESKKNGLERMLLDALKEIEAVREFYDAVADEQGIEVRCEGNGILNADPLLFRQALSNLLSNALQFTPAGGKVVLSIKQTEDEAVEVTVKDTGFGIAPEHLPKVFDRFYRVDPSRSSKISGAGLGLAIVKSIMDLHGGTVSIKSEPNQGTTVILSFPQPA